MINIKELRLIQIIQTQALPKPDEIISFQDDIIKYAYPIGIIPPEAFNTKLFLEGNLDHNLEYIETLLNLLFANYYSKEEIAICATFLSFNILTSILLNETYIKRITPLLSKHSDKDEIQYIIDELKYRYLQYLLYSHTDDAQIDSLIEELSLIETEHNTFFLRQRIK